ncbi:hypothetical protein SEPCBS119000_005082 [Sporothrix epigloea]|uniref:Uncharacterized protein n=1 Tax=Sporothrix epigloea TaxID=1892477 RepID=A0ABP0DVZ0_9PEZI
MDSIDTEMYEFPSGGGYDLYPSQAESAVGATTEASQGAATTARSHLYGSGHHVFDRRRSVYDAVAGRIRIRHARPSEGLSRPPSFRITKLAPEEVLFRGAKAPPRFEETDKYFAHTDLADDVLPPSDLVKAIHHYAGHYYEALARRQGVPGAADEKTEKTEETEQTEQSGQRQAQESQTAQRLVDERSMDETALLAFGILMEEAARDVLGARGALVLTEAADEEEEDEEVDNEEDESGGE